MTSPDTLTSFADGVWLTTHPVSIVGMPLAATMAVLQLAGDSLLVYSPVALTPERRAAVEALGQVAHLYAPNLFHHSWIEEWATAFPSARVHVPAGLSKKHPGLRMDHVHGAKAEPEFSDILDEVPIAGCRLGETALLYRPARTLLVADLVHNVGRPEHAWTKAYTRMMGFYDRVALSKVIRWTAFSDRAAARSSIDQLLSLDFDRLVVGHGAPLETGAKQALRDAFTWLR